MDTTLAGGCRSASLLLPTLSPHQVVVLLQLGSNECPDSLLGLLWHQLGKKGEWWPITSGGRSPGSLVWWWFGGDLKSLITCSLVRVEVQAPGGCGWLGLFLSPKTVWTAEVFVIMEKSVFGCLPTNPYPVFILASLCLDISWTILKTLVIMGRASPLFKTYFWS